MNKGGFEIFSKFNMILILINIAILVISIYKESIFIINGALFIITLLFGLFYSLNEYKKNSSNLYKWFMLIYSFVSLYDIMTFFLLSNNVDSFDFVLYLTISIRILIMIGTFLLSFVKDFGKKSSLNIAIMILVGGLVLFIINLIYKGENGSYVIYMTNLLLSLTTYLSVKGKYLDKQLRGSK